MQNLLDSYAQDLTLIYPELILASGILLVLILDLVGKQSKVNLCFYLSLTVVLLSSFVLLISEPANHPIFFKSIYPNEYSVFFRLLADFSMLFILIFWKTEESEESRSSPEYLYIWLSVLFAVHFLIISNHWMMVFLSIEFVSISSYILIGMGLRKRNIESAFKYLVFGALSSGIMVFGISLIFVSTNNLFFSGFEFTFGDAFESIDLLTIGLLMAFGGILFKTSLFPFHFWAPDVYQGTSLPIMSMISLLPKIAAFGFVSSQMLIIFPTGFIATGNLSFFLAGIGIISMMWGNFSALRQSSFARLFAYSGIAQSGFMILALINGFEGIQQLEIYLALYVFVIFIVFISASILKKPIGEIQLNDFSGLGKRQIWLGGSMVICMISLIGLPPSGLFMAKFVIFSSLFEWYSLDAGIWKLIIFILAILNIVISLFYYLRIPFFMYFRDGDAEVKNNQNIKIGFIGLCSLILILAFFFFNDFRELIKYLGADII